MSKAQISMWEEKIVDSFAGGGGASTGIELATGRVERPGGRGPPQRGGMTMGKTNFDRITASPEALASFLASLPCLDAPWDDDFHRIFCDNCPMEDCPKVCPHEAERNSPAWWLSLSPDLNP